MYMAYIVWVEFFHLVTVFFCGRGIVHLAFVAVKCRGPPHLWSIRFFSTWSIGKHHVACLNCILYKPCFTKQSNKFTVPGPETHNNTQLQLRHHIPAFIDTAKPNLTNLFNWSSAFATFIKLLLPTNERRNIWCLIIYFLSSSTINFWFEVMILVAAVTTNYSINAPTIIKLVIIEVLRLLLNATNRWTSNR